MRTFSKIILSLSVVGLFLTSCKKEENGGGEELGFGNSYIVNYGSYGGTNSSISQYDTEANVLTNNVYKAANGVEITSNVQYAYEYDGKVYFMGNDADQVFYVDKETLDQSKNGITADIIKPRYCVGMGNYLYISCWGGDIWADNSLSYIAKYNISTDEVEKKIELTGGPEGLEIANGKLYAALNYDTKVAVMDLATDAISYIETPGPNSYFLKDKNDNLYVSMVSTFSNPSAEAGLGYINTQTDELEAKYALEGVSTSYASIMQFNQDQSKIYVLGTDGGWPPVGAINTFDVSKGEFLEEPFVTGITGLNGLAVNPETGNVYTFISENTTAAGKMVIYSENGDSITYHNTGISPSMALFVSE